MRHLDCYELVKERLKIGTANCPPPVPRTSAQKRAVPKSRSAGLSDIVLELNASKRGMQSTKTGCSFISMVEEEERRKTTKTLELNGKSVTVHNPSVFLSHLINTAGSKMCLVMPGKVHQQSRKNVWHDPNDLKDLPEEGSDVLVDTSGDTDKASKEQIRKQFFAKLQSVYAILCCISGIKIKDLKNKETLPLDVIKGLCHKPRSPLPKSQFYSRHHKQYFQNPILLMGGNPQRIVRNGLQRLDREGQLKEKIAAYHHLKGVVASAAKAAIKKRQLHLQDYLLAKIKELDQKSGLDAKDVLNLARMKAFEQTRDREAEEKENNPNWLCELQKEAHLAFSPDNTSVNRQLENLRIFIGIDGSTPCVIEKLCYFVMSLPANHLCTRPMIAAIQFVLEYVMNTSPNLCQQWFEIRRLPFIANEVTACSHIFDLTATF
eukprot:Em0005g1187a